MVPLLTELMDDSHVQIVKNVCHIHHCLSDILALSPLLQYLDTVSSSSTVDTAERSLQVPVYREG